MTLGQKLRQARIRAGLTQRQAAGDRITRNMLSQIENDLAAPSMKTLEYLSATLGVTAGWLLADETSDEAAERLPRAKAMLREADVAGCLALLEPAAEQASDEELLLLATAAAELAQRLLAQEDADIVLVDFHAEATSEKLALGWYLDGRVSAVWGTHTHVPTADGKILPKGTGHITDLGMTGPANSILGIRPEQSINIFLGGLPQRYEAAPGKCKLESVLFTIDTNTKRCIRTQRVDLQE